MEIARLIREQALTNLARSNKIRLDLRGGPETSASDGFHDRALDCSQPSEHVLPGAHDYARPILRQ